MNAISKMVPSQVALPKMDSAANMQSNQATKNAKVGDNMGRVSAIPEQGKGAILSKFDSGPMTMAKSPGK
jgi:hypothetical protein